MNVQQLRTALKAEGLEAQFASSAAEAKDGAYVVDRTIGQGWCVYCITRGQRTGERYFITEAEACEFISDQLFPSQKPQGMDICQLREALRAANIAEWRYSLSGEPKGEAHVLEREKIPEWWALFPEKRDLLERETKLGWWVYYCERGQRRAEHYFLTEDEACRFLLGKLKK